jgi:hypothetical protein
LFRIVQFDRLLKYVVVLTIAVSVGSYSIIQQLWDPNFSLFKIITIASLLSGAVIFILFTPFCARKIWRLVGYFDASLFPDLNGTWSGKVIFESGKELQIRAVIRQTLSATQIDIHSETMKSTTLETTPTIEQGQKKLYYLYRAWPKNPSWPSYNGTTLFDVRSIDNGATRLIELSGSYYTDRKTTGRIQLSKVSDDVSRDVAYY